MGMVVAAFVLLFALAACSEFKLSLGAKPTDVPEGQQGQGPGPGQGDNEPTDHPPIVDVVVDGKTLKSLSFDELKKMGQPLPKNIARFQDQTAVPLAEVFKQVGISKAEKVQFAGSEGEQIEFSWKDVTEDAEKFYLVSRHGPYWKLTRSEGEVNPRSFVLRVLFTINVFTQKDAAGNSPTVAPNPAFTCANTTVYTDYALALANAENICILNLANQGLTEVPPDIYKLKYLTTLYLGHNQLKEVPPVVGVLGNLTTLNLDSNQLTEIPPALGALRKLKQLKLGRNQLTEIPPELGSLQKLEHLELDNNQLTELPPELGNLKSLAELEAENNKLTQLPAEFANLKNLKSAGLGGNNFSEAEKVKIKQMFPNAQVEF